MSFKPEAEVFVVDVCGTLVHDDTTIGLLRHHFARSNQRRFRSLVFWLISSRHSPIWFALAVLERLTGQHLLKHLAVRLVEGDQVEELNHSAAEYATLLIENRLVQTIYPLLGVPLNSGRLVLASASLEPIVSSLATALGARYVASELEQSGGVLTGRYAVDLTGCKEQALNEKFGNSLLAGKVCAISNDVSDRHLLEKATRAYVVLHRESHRKRWDGFHATFVKVR